MTTRDGNPRPLWSWIPVAVIVLTCLPGLAIVGDLAVGVLLSAEARQHVSLQRAAGYDAVATWRKYFVPAVLIFVTAVFGGGIAAMVILGSLR